MLHETKRNLIFQNIIFFRITSTPMGIEFNMHVVDRMCFAHPWNQSIIMI